MSTSQRIFAVESKGEMSKQLDNANRFTMETFPSVGRFSSDYKVTLHTKGSSAKFSDIDRHKSMEPPRTVPAPPSYHHQPSPQPRPVTDIVDLRTAIGYGWKVPDPASSPASPSTERHCEWYNRSE